MTRYQIAFIAAVCLVLLWAIVNSLQPGGDSIPWFLGLLCLALLSYYFGFVDLGFNPLRFHAKAGFLVFLALALLMAYVARVENEALSDIAEYVTVYPRIEQVNFVPRTSDKTLQHWQIETGDPVPEIKQFYSDRRHLGNWEVVREKPALVLEQDNRRLTITIGEQPRSSSSLVFYHLEHK